MADLTTMDLDAMPVGATVTGHLHGVPTTWTRRPDGLWQIAPPTRPPWTAAAVIVLALDLTRCPAGAP